MVTGVGKEECPTWERFGTGDVGEIRGILKELPIAAIVIGL